MVHRGRAELGDLLLLFIYLEIGAMVGIYFKTTRLPVRYLIYIAITALGRVLIELVSAEHRTGMDILVVSGAILLLSFAVLVLRFGSNRFPSNGSAADAKSGPPTTISKAKPSARNDLMPSALRAQVDDLERRWITKLDEW